MMWRVVNRMVPFMNETFLTIRRKFMEKFTGLPASQPRWMTCVSTANAQYEFIAGRMYVDDHFPDDAKWKVHDVMKRHPQIV